MEKETEVICISSDDESDSQKENKTEKFVTNSAETSNGVFAIAKSETLLSDNEKAEEKNLKRKIYTEKDEITCNVEKKKKLDDADQGTSKKVINKSGFCSVYIREIHPVKTNCINALPNKKQEVFKKAQLIVKEKKRISYVSHDVFPLFISLCSQKCPQSERTDMEKIIDKLKRHYENMDPIYAGSENFVTFINEKREAIMSDDKKIYVYIQEVVNEMKRRINRSNSQASRINEIYDAVPSTSYAANKVPVNNVAESDDDDSEISDDNEENANPETKRKIKAILHTMKKCEAVIKKLEEEDVDFNDENNSTYIKETRYKQKMVELYTKLCELTGENADAGRVYLRPKHLNVTRIGSVDQAITNFINSKITRRNQMKKIGARTNDLIFPDYRDILKCVNRCNDKKKLGLSENTCQQLAEKGFKELGEYLQRVRRNDYWDTFSLYLENKEDPAIKDKDLAKKLANNRIDGDKRLAAVFAKYEQKQAEITDQNDEEITSEEEENEDEEESIIDDDKNELSITSENDSDIQENKDKTIKEDRLLVEKTKPVNMVNVYRAVDKPISNKTTTNTIQKKKCNEIVEIKARKKSNINTAVSKNEIRTINEKIVHEPCSSNMILQNVVKNVDVKTRAQEDSLPAASMANCTKDLAVAKPKDLSKVITDPAKKRVTKHAADTVTRITTELTTGDTAELTTRDAAELIIDTVDLMAKDTAELITGDLTETIMEEVITDEMEIITETEVMDGTLENMPNDEQPEEEQKTLLRLRSFAKAPTTWEDSQHKTDKIAQGNAPKVTNQIKEVVDLTSETTATKPPVITKCSVQLGNKIIPITKARQTVLIPANRNIISVQNITNNYLKVNARTGKIIAPVRDIDGSTIIRLPSVQSTSRQSQPQSAKVFAFKGNEILRIIPNKSIIIPKNSSVQSVSKQTDVSSSTTKSK
ncbi:PREDICTED: MATH and LRR domain-containing protein PFE0570w [Wasmannia auropunctata]|uniref:MATH and LRR domain-containing protein PFE0570w n=1 Tax=Wasmannia auropunctata TaxID=64793 RepID=UPI0005EDAD0F|nr:PREDICTED: MATH and LRR domain-containing protein PFE0570w [Wasmannia auropunctata]